MSLYLDRAALRIHHTAELYEEAVTGCFDEPAAMRSDHRHERLSLYVLEGLESTALVRSHQTRIPHHVGGEDCSEATGLAHSSGKPMLRNPTSNVLARSVRYAGSISQGCRV